VDLLNLADGQYTYSVRYLLGGQVIDQATGVFSAAPGGSSTTQLSFLANPSFDPSSAKQVNSFHYDAAGRLDSSADAEGKTETYGYDQDGNKTSFTNKKGATWNYLYDSAGRLTSEISPLVDITNFDRDTLAPTASTARLETRMEYDALGNVTSRTEAYGRLGEARKTQYVYDALGRQIATIYPSMLVYDSTTDNLATNGLNGNVSIFEKTLLPETDVSFDALSNATVNRNASGYYSYKAYDALGRVKYEIDADNYVTEYGYDTFGNKTTTTRYAVPLDFSKAIGPSGRIPRARHSALPRSWRASTTPLSATRTIARSRPATTVSTARRRWWSPRHLRSTRPLRREARRRSRSVAPPRISTTPRVRWCCSAS